MRCFNSLCGTQIVIDTFFSSTDGKNGLTAELVCASFTLGDSDGTKVVA
jgi:hypothetical protein